MFSEFSEIITQIPAPNSDPNATAASTATPPDTAAAPATVAIPAVNAAPANPDPKQPPADSNTIDPKFVEMAKALIAKAKADSAPPATPVAAPG